MIRAFLAGFGPARPAICLIAWLSCQIFCWALEPLHRIAQYAHNSWTAQARQLPGAVFAITQTADGNLWIGTEYGLFRFDGSRFVTWQSPDGARLPGQYVTALRAARDGSLWIGTREGLAHFKSNRLDVFRTATGNLGPGVSAIVEDRRGTVWAGTVGGNGGGLCRVSDRKLDCQELGPPKIQGLQSLFEDASGELWGGGYTAVYRGAEQSRQTEDVLSVGAASIVADADGGIWIASGGRNGVMHGVHGRFATVPEIGRSIYPRVLLRDRDGALWIGTSTEGLVHFSQGRTDNFQRSNNLSHDMVFCLFEDREGTIWVGTADGLDSFRDFAVTTLSKHDGLASDSIMSVAADRSDRVWIGTPNGVNVMKAKSEGRDGFALFDAKQGLPSSSISAMFEDNGGRLWIDSQAGMVALTDGLISRPFTLCTKMVNLSAAAQDRDGSLWFSDLDSGLIHYNGTAAEVTPWSVFDGKQASALESDPNQGGVWLGFSQGGIAYYKPPRSPQWFASSSGLPAGTISDLHMSADGSLWVATENGLDVVRGQSIKRLDARQGLPCDQVHDIVEDDQRALWLNTACGLVRIYRADLDGWLARPNSKVAAKLYDANDGMPMRAIQSGYFRRAVRSTDGRLWFTGVSALAMIDPHHIRENRLPPPVVIESITADRQTYASTSGLTFAPRTRDLEIDYAALSFVAPQKVRYKYRLYGYDGDWKDVGDRRQAVYTNLGPGHYRFQVIAANNDGVWNTSGATASFVILPAIYQTPLFWAFCFAAALFFLWLFFRYQLRQNENRLNLEFEARLHERNRIARDLHDTIVQNITGLSLQLRGVMKMVSGPEPATQILRELRDESEKWLGELRDSIWDLRGSEPAELDLRTALEKAAQTVIMGEPLSFRIMTVGHACPTTPFVQEQLTKILQEALRNAMRHGHAKNVAVRLGFKRRRSVRVHIRDDGRGFDLEQATRAGHFGLENMQERARDLGAEFKIISAPGKGTEIQIFAPVGANRAKK